MGLEREGSTVSKVHNKQVYCKWKASPEGLVTESLQSKFSDVLGLLGTSSLGVIIKLLLVSLKTLTYSKNPSSNPFSKSLMRHRKPPTTPKVVLKADACDPKAAYEMHIGEN